MIINFQLSSGCHDLIMIEVIFIFGGMTLFGYGRTANRSPREATNQHATVIKIFVEKNQHQIIHTQAFKYGINEHYV